MNYRTHNDGVDWNLRIGKTFQKTTTATFATMKALFGKPQIEDGKSKWVVQYEDGTLAVIDGGINLPLGEKHEWNIGSDSPRAIELVLKSLMGF